MEVDASVNGSCQEWAYVRWLSPADHSPATEHLRMPRLRWSTQMRRSVRVPWTDLVPLADLIEPVLIQADESAPGYFFYNPHARVRVDSTSQ